MKLADPSTAAEAWQQLVALNKYEVFNFDKGLPVDVWPQKPGSFFPGYVWVRQGHSLRCVSPRGEILDSVIVLNEKQPAVLWNGMLPDGQPGIAFSHNLGQPRGYFFCLSGIVPEGRQLIVARLMVEDAPADLTVVVESTRSAPRFVLRTADGKQSEEFEFPHGGLQRDAATQTSNPPNEPAPWRVILRW